MNEGGKIEEMEGNFGLCTSSSAKISRMFIKDDTYENVYMKKYTHAACRCGLSSTPP